MFVSRIELTLCKLLRRVNIDELLAPVPCSGIGNALGIDISTHVDGPCEDEVEKPPENILVYPGNINSKTTFKTRHSLILP